MRGVLGSVSRRRDRIFELERLQQKSQPSFIVFAWPALWWQDYYTGLRDHLQTRFPYVVENDRLIAFDLKPGRQSGHGKAVPLMH